VVDALADCGIPSVGPEKSLARLETSNRYPESGQQIQYPGNPRFKVFCGNGWPESFLNELAGIVINRTV